MIEIGSSLLIIITFLAMIGSLLLILIPAVPVTSLEWAIALIFGVLTGFERFTPLAAILVTGLMILGSTSGLWLPFVGMRGRQISCFGMIAFFIGMAIGSSLIPIPFLGTIIGGVIAVMLVEYLRIGKAKEAVASGKSALRMVIYGMIAEFVFATAIIVTTMASILMTG
ncbi:MAG: DUF456 family protein [Anaerolineae bacterium]|nr:DUF456 family protein [Anaerolineae bacterium]MDQ7035328.1 DUF456 family protein [Anaerolineae bacterium]